VIGCQHCPLRLNVLITMHKNQITNTASRAFPILRRGANGQLTHTTDVLAIEEPLEIRLGYGDAHRRQHASVSVTMRTPGQDEALALGFLFSEGIISRYEEVLQWRFAGPEDYPQNVIVVELQAGVRVDMDRLKRHFYTSSSCGICGKASLEQLQLMPGYYPPPGSPTVAADQLISWPDRLLSAQSTFARTGGLHAAGLFSSEGELLLLHEDVGRHNALDKIIGEAFRRQWLPLRSQLLLLSGRASFELVQKALMAGLPMVAAVGAPSSLAVELAAMYDLSLVGFLRDGRFNVYSGEERIIFA